MNSANLTARRVVIYVHSMTNRRLYAMMVVAAFVAYADLSTWWVS